MTDWTQAACQGYAVETFFTDDHYAQRVAQKVCTPCPIRMFCFQEAMDGHLYGVWGGSTEQQRARIRRRQNRRKAKAAA